MVISESGSFRTLNIPLTSFRNFKLEQPWFSANYVSATILPTPGGGLQRTSTLTLTFTEGGKVDTYILSTIYKLKHKCFYIIGAIEFTNVYRNLMEQIAIGGTVMIRIRII